MYWKMETAEIRKENGQYLFDQPVNGLTVHAHYSEHTVETVFIPLLRQWTAMQQERGERLVVFLAAPPAAGKSTLVSFLQALSQQTPGAEPLTAIGMDGFHLPQEYLLTHTVRVGEGDVPMAAIKGAPVTFDLPGLKRRIQRLKEEDVCPWPLYNRMLHNPEEGKIQVSRPIALLEGNYLLLEQAGWCDLKQYCDVSVRILADGASVRERLVLRKMHTGLSRREAEQFVDGSDLPNVALCAAMQRADVTLRLTDTGDYVRVEEP